MDKRTQKSMIYTICMFVFIAIFNKFLQPDLPIVASAIFALWSGVGYYLGLGTAKIGKVVLIIFIIAFLVGVTSTHIVINFVTDIVIYFSIAYYFSSRAGG